MSKIFIKNPTSQNVAVNLEAGEGGYINNSGPEGAVSTYAGRTGICLAPEPTIVEPLVMVSGTFNLTGRYIVQVNGELVPYIFSAEDLATYFDADNSNVTNVQFEVQPQ